MDDYELKDSGARRTFGTGAVRDRGGDKPRPDLISPYTAKREGVVLGKGAVKYETRNWEKGMPISDCIASCERHIMAYKMGLTDEDHLAQARTNLGFAIHFEEMIALGVLSPELGDMPKYAKQPEYDDDFEDPQADRNMPLLPPTPTRAVVPTGKVGWAKSYAIDPVAAVCGSCPEEPESEPLRVYVSHSIRGRYGINATDEQMAANCLLAKQYVAEMREACPTVDFYVPADHEEFVNLAFKSGFINEASILEVDCKILDDCDAALFFNPDGFMSRGMLVEHRHTMGTNTRYVSEYKSDGSEFCPLTSARSILNSLAVDKKAGTL